VYICWLRERALFKSNFGIDNNLLSRAVIQRTPLSITITGSEYDVSYLE